MAKRTAVSGSSSGQSQNALTGRKVGKKKELLVQAEADAVRSELTSDAHSVNGSKVASASAGLGDGGPCVALGRMEPSTAEIERKPRNFARPSSAAEPRRGLEQKNRESTLRQAPSRSDAGGAATDDCDIEVSDHLGSSHRIVMACGASRCSFVKYRP